jgi:glucose uptake protein
MLTVLYALVTVLAWGTWLAVVQNVRFPNQSVKTFYVTVANLALAAAVLLVQGPGRLAELPAASFWLVFAGGVIWTLSGLCAFAAAGRIGLAGAFGIWAPLNILTSMVWGALLFHEFPSTSPWALLWLGVALVITIAGVLLIIFAKGRAAADRPAGRQAWLGYAGAIGAGVLWGSYFIPIQYAGVSMWLGAFPLALGMAAGGGLLTLLARQAPRLARLSDYLRALASGLIWGLGNYSMLLLVGDLGAGRGFTIAQAAIVVNALLSVFVLKDPAPRTRAAWLTLLGCLLATVGAILLGNL